MKYLVASLIFLAIAFGIVKLKKPHTVTPQELNLTVKKEVLAKIVHLPLDTRKDTLSLFPKTYLKVQVSSDLHPIALQIGSKQLPLQKIRPGEYRTRPVHIEGKRIEAFLLFAPKKVYKIPKKAIFSDGNESYVFTLDQGKKRPLAIQILKTTKNDAIVHADLANKKVVVP